MGRIFVSAVAFALIAFPPAAVTAQNGQLLEARELDVGDPQLERVLFVAVDHLFNVKTGLLVGFNGVVIKKRPEASLTAAVRSRLTSRGLAKIDRPGDCDTPLPSRPGATPPAGPGRTPAAVGTPRAQSGAICNRSFDYSYSFHMVRVAGDSAYVETHREGVSQSLTQCVVLAVAPEGGWRAIDVRRSKIGKCGG